jgi:hypothetical protein
MKRTAVFVLLCALVFGSAASWLGPKMIAYWYTPPIPAGAASVFNCTDAVMWAMNRLVWTQIIGSAFGAILGLVIGVLLGRGKPVSSPPPATSAPTKTA